MIPLPISLLAGLGQVHAREDQFTGVQALPDLHRDGPVGAAVLLADDHVL